LEIDGLGEAPCQIHTPVDLVIANISQRLGGAALAESVGADLVKCRLSGAAERRLAWRSMLDQRLYARYGAPDCPGFLTNE
jgi:hypothetical protein